MRPIRFELYGDVWHALTLEEMLAAQAEHHNLWARAENSGSESCYCEVAVWNDDARQWQRFATCKCMDYRLPELPEATDAATAEALAAMINKDQDERIAVIHRMPNYVPSKTSGD